LGADLSIFGTKKRFRGVKYPNNKNFKNYYFLLILYDVKRGKEHVMERPEI
jgi:hypothetical protein